MMPNLARVWQYEEEGKRNFSFPFFVVLLRFFFITITKVKHQLRHIFTFTFSSTSRQQSTNFFTISSSLSHQLHERKVPTSSHFLLHFFINFTKGKYQLRHNFIFTFSSTSRKESINFNTFSHSLSHQLHERKASTSTHFHIFFFRDFLVTSCELASVKVVLTYSKFLIL